MQVHKLLPIFLLVHLCQGCEDVDGECELICKDGDPCALVGFNLDKAHRPDWIRHVIKTWCTCEGKCEYNTTFINVPSRITTQQSVIYEFRCRLDA
jgi:hypothetical protein